MWCGGKALGGAKNGSNSKWDEYLRGSLLSMDKLCFDLSSNQTKEKGCLHPGLVGWCSYTFIKKN